MKKRKLSDIFVVGFALFAIFFGAGNLIFPPQIGVLAGDRWWQSMLGFLLADPLLPVLGVVVTASVGGNASDLGKRIGDNFTKIVCAISILIMGPIFAIPRTAATTHEIAIKYNLPSIPLWVTSLVFLGLTLFFALNQSGVIDKIGKYLTPGLLIALTIIIVKSILSPPETMIETPAKNLFLGGFKQGYQTMDALGAALMTGLVIDDLIRKGYTNPKERMKALIGVALVVIALLGFVYGGLTYMGATTGKMFNESTGQVDIVVKTVKVLLGNAGSVIIGIGVALACLTTSVGLTAICGNFFQDITKGKLKYKWIVIATILISFPISLLGVNGLISLAGPVLTIVYPIMIVLILMTIFDKYIKYDWTYTGAVIGAVLVSLPIGLDGFFHFLPKGFVDKLPLSNIGFEWLIPAVVCSILMTILQIVLKKKNRVVRDNYNVIES